MGRRDNYIAAFVLVGFGLLAMFVEPLSALVGLVWQPLEGLIEGAGVLINALTPATALYWGFLVGLAFGLLSVRVFMSFVDRREAE